MAQMINDLFEAPVHRGVSSLLIFVDSKINSLGYLCIHDGVFY